MKIEVELEIIKETALKSGIEGNIRASLGKLPESYRRLFAELKGVFVHTNSTKAILALDAGKEGVFFNIENDVGTELTGVGLFLSGKTSDEYFLRHATRKIDEFCLDFTDRKEWAEAIAKDRNTASLALLAHQGLYFAFDDGEGGFIEKSPLARPDEDIYGISFLEDLLALKLMLGRIKSANEIIETQAEQLGDEKLSSETSFDYIYDYITSDNVNRKIEAEKDE